MSAKDQIKQIVDYFKREPQLKDKTDGMAEGLMLGANLADEANERSKDAKETTLAIQEKYKEQILTQDLNPNKDPELVDIRDGSTTAGERIRKFEQETNRQLVQTESTSLDWINITKMPPPFAQAKGDGIFDNTGVIQSAIDNYDTIFIPNGIFRFNGDVRQTKTIKIVGSSHLSRLRCYGRFISDTDSNHKITLSGFTFENFRVTGNAMIIEKNNTASALSALDIDRVFFFSNNNVSSELDSTSLYIKGVRESNITNCLFAGQSSAYGSALSFGASPTQMTMNISMSGNVFYNYGKFISAKTEAVNKIYLAGLRIIDNTFIAGKIGIDLLNVDTVHILNNMIDYVREPIIMHNVSGYNVKSNYLQSLDGPQLILIANISTSPLKFGNIKDNTFWSSNDNYITDGLVMLGSGGQITMPIIADNNFQKVKTCISLNNVFNANVHDNVAENSKVFLDGNGNSSLAKIHHNFAEQTVVEMFKNLGAASRIGDENYHGTKASQKKGRAILNGDGTTGTFTVAHGLFKIPSFANVTAGSASARGDFYVTFDATNLTIVYATAPSAGTSNVILNWSAEV